MRHMGNSGRIAIAAFLATAALFVLTGITLHEAVLMWSLAAAATAYVACVAEVVIRRRHKTLAASGVGTILFIAFGIAFLRQWGLAFNADPSALTAPVTTAHPDLYFYLAGAAGAATLLVLLAGTVLPGRRGAGRGHASRRPASALRSGARGAYHSPGTAPHASQRGPAARVSATRGAAPGSATARPAPGGPAARASGSRPTTPRPTPRTAPKAASPKSPPARPPAPGPARTSTRR